MPEYSGLLIIIIVSSSIMGVIFLIQLFHDYSKQYENDEEEKLD